MGKGGREAAVSAHKAAALRSHVAQSKQKLAVVPLLEKRAPSGEVRGCEGAGGGEGRSCGKAVGVARAPVLDTAPSGAACACTGGSLCEGLLSCRALRASRALERDFDGLWVA